MRTILAAAALLACLPMAHAQDKGKSDFTHSAEFRLRDTFEQNESGNNSVSPSHHNGIAQRFKLGLGFKANEKLSMNATLLQAAMWGQSSGDKMGDRGQTGGPAGEPTNGGDEPNFMSVNEAYATWMVSDDFSAKFGRMNFGFGDGSVMSINDWEQQPYSFDGVTLKYEAEFARFTGFVFKYRDFTDGITRTANSDGQHDAYGLVFDLKTMPEMIKMINAYFIQDVQDGVYGGGSTATVTGGQNMDVKRYGALASLAFGMFDLKAGYNMVSGKNSAIDKVVAPVEHTINQNMMQIQAGVNLAAFMQSRLWLAYHRDSGTSAGDAGTKDNTYDPYFYDKHDGSGPMQIIGWGNLTDFSLGWNLKPMDSTDVGLSYHKFSRTNTDSGIMYGTFGGHLAQPSTTDSAIGSEADVWAEHTYGGGLSTMARVGYFMPDSALKNTVATNATNGEKMSASIMQVQIQGKLTF